MSTKNKIVISVLALAVSFAFGRYSAPSKVLETNKSASSEKKSVNDDSELNKHKKTITHEIERKDGTKEIVTIVDEDTEAKNKQKSSDDTSSSTSSSKEIIRGSGVNISILVGLSVDALSSPLYGASANKSILGPITVGAWGLSNKTLGVSLGIQL